MSRLWPAVGAIGALTYLLIDGHAESWLNGLPWRPPSLAVAVVGGIVLWVVWPRAERGAASGGADRTGDSEQSERAARPSAPWPAVVAASLAALALAKALVGGQALPTGLPGWYYDNSRFQGEHERSTDFLGEPWTRRDRELEFGGDEFPAYFLNDVQRFNFYGAEAERRRNLPFSARWEGVLYVPAAGTYQLWLTASGPATLRLDGRQVAVVDADGRDTSRVEVTLAQGSHPLRLTYARRPPRSPDLKLEWDVDGRRQPVRAPYLFPAEVTPAAWQADRLVLATSRALDGLFLAVGLGALVALACSTIALARRALSLRWPLAERALLAAWPLAVFAGATAPRLDRLDKLTLLGGGQDWLTHESFARDILLNGPLMTLGKPLGEGRTFYAQPFYPYALAGFHALTGEDLFGVLAVQVTLASLSGVLVYFLAKRLFGLPAAIAAAALYLPLWFWHLEWVAYRLISEAIFFAILPALLLALVRSVADLRRRDLALAGLLLGLAIVTRGPTLLFVPFVLAVLWCAARRGGFGRAVAARRLAVVLGCALLIVGLVPLRNYVVAGQPALLASSGGVNLQKLHRPTNAVRLGQAQERWFAPFIQDAPTRETIEFVLQDPAGYARATALLAAYTLGYGAAVEESQVTIWPELVALNLAYVLTVILLARARALSALLLHAYVLIHFLTMIIFVPYDYDNRLVLPMFLPIVVVAGGGVAGLAAGVARRVRSESARAARPALVARHDAEGM